MIKKIFALAMAVATCFLAACSGGNESSSNSSTSNESTVCVQHQCTKIRAKAATCEKDGNIEYWSCYLCDKLFSDANATQELSAAETVVAKLSHSPVFVGENESTCSMKGNKMDAISR